MIHLRIELGSAIRDPGWTCSVTSVRVISLISCFSIASCSTASCSSSSNHCQQQERQKPREGITSHFLHITLASAHTHTQTPLLEQFIVRLKFPTVGVYHHCGFWSWRFGLSYLSLCRRAQVNAEQCRDPFTRNPWQATCDFFSSMIITATMATTQNDIHAPLSASNTVSGMWSWAVVPWIHWKWGWCGSRTLKISKKESPGAFVLDIYIYIFFFWSFFCFWCVGVGGCWRVKWFLRYLHPQVSSGHGELCCCPGCAWRASVRVWGVAHMCCVNCGHESSPILEVRYRLYRWRNY